MALMLNDRVVVVARDEFYSFVDGWEGVVTGWNSGAVQVSCPRSDGMKTLFVPENQLVLSLNAQH